MRWYSSSKRFGRRQLRKEREIPPTVILLQARSPSKAPQKTLQRDRNGNKNYTPFLLKI